MDLRLRAFVGSAVIIASSLPAGCGPAGSTSVRAADSASGRAVGTFIPMPDEPTYHLLDGYDERWLVQIREGIEMARGFWGSYGPAHVWVVGVEEGAGIDDATRSGFLDEYCQWRIAGTERTADECRMHATRRFLDPADRGEPEAYLSWVDEFEQPEAELVFINVHRWHFEEDVVPDPVMRGIHEYTHVAQMGFGTMPTWMMEGGAVFSEAWLPALAGRREAAFIMDRLMDRALEIRHTGFTIADMEDVDAAAPEVRRYHRELAYDAGAWAVVLLIHQSPSGSVTAFRDEFLPMVTELGWEAALCRYLDIEGKEEFYLGFESFMNAPRRTQLVVLDELQP